MANLFKAYGSDHYKYSGATKDNFERNIMLFQNRCDHADVPDDDQHQVFFIMLTSHARQYDFDTLKYQNLYLCGLEIGMESRLLAPERTRALLREWESLSLTRIIACQSDLSASACLELPLEELSDIQTSLSLEYRNETDHSSQQTSQR